MGTNTITYLDRTFDAHDVLSGNAYYARPLNSASLEIDTFSFDVQSDDTSLTEFIRNTPLTFYHDGNQMGIFYVQTISRTSINTYHFTCTSTVGLLDETYHDGGIYTGETVREVCTDICKPLICYVKSNIANIKLYGWLPIATRRENLAQVLFAIGATLKVDYNGAIRIEGLWDGQSSEITASEMYAGGSVEYATPVTEVIVTEHAYSQSTTEVTELFNGTTSAGDKITFDDPCYDLEATGFEITESGANYAIVTAGSGVLNGKKYTHVTRQIITPTNTRNRSLVEQSDNTVKVENATLVSLVNANAVAERLAEYYSHNERINNKIAIKRETPGDVVQITHPYGGEVTGCIESADVTVSGRLAAQESVLVGYKPQDIAEQEYYDTVEVLTEDGTWTVPAGVTNLRVVLIGGGAGGNPGEKGGEAKEYSGAYNYSDSSITDYNRYQSGYGYYYGGDGGSGGDGGLGGKIMQSTLKVTGGDAFDVSIGQGGSGKVFGENDESHNGGDTTFGSLHSHNGSANPSGYTDAISGKVYAGIGEIGITGGKGGGADRNSDQPQVNYVLGEAVGEFHPGGIGSTSNHSDGYLVHSGNYEHQKVYAGVSGIGGGGIGGGAAFGSNGGRGSDGTSSALASSSRLYARGTGGKGGAGATALPPEAQTLIGYGGCGGNGGGGAGSAGFAVAERRVPKKYSYSGTWDASANDNKSKNGIPGNGSNGGDGASGCVLVYYRLPKTLAASGAVHDKNGKIISDKYGRRLIV